MAVEPQGKAEVGGWSCRLEVFPRQQQAEGELAGQMVAVAAPEVPVVYLAEATLLH